MGHAKTGGIFLLLEAVLFTFLFFDSTCGKSLHQKDYLELYLWNPSPFPYHWVIGFASFSFKSSFKSISLLLFEYKL